MTINTNPSDKIRLSTLQALIHLEIELLDYQRLPGKENAKNYDYFVETRIKEEVLDLIDLFFTWGEKQENEYAPKPKFASLLNGQTIQTITLDDAMDLFKLPRTVGEWEEKEIVASVGRFGPYLRYDGKFTSIKKTDEEDPLTISLSRAIELIKIKIQADKD